MICKQCGNQVAPDAKFCGICGAPNDAVADQFSQPQYAQPEQSAQPQYGQPVQPQYGQPVQPPYGQPVQPPYGQPMQPQYTQPQYGQPQPVVTPESQSMSGSILGFGIAAIICAWFPIGSILGIIFGAIAKGRAKTFDAMGYPTNGRRVTGKVLGMIGFISGIIMTVYWTYFLLIGIALV